MALSSQSLYLSPAQVTLAPQPAALCPLYSSPHCTGICQDHHNLIGGKYNGNFSSFTYLSRWHWEMLHTTFLNHFPFCFVMLYFFSSHSPSFSASLSLVHPSILVFFTILFLSTLQFLHFRGFFPSLLL